MDTQLKKGLLDACVLSVLSGGKSYGYKIVQEMTDCVKISESTLYPILRRLEVAGCLNTSSAEHNGRLRKYYSITAQGRGKIEDFLSEFDEILNIYTFIRESTSKGGNQNDA